MKKANIKKFLGYNKCYFKDGRTVGNTIIKNGEVGIFKSSTWAGVGAVKDAHGFGAAKEIGRTLANSDTYSAAAVLLAPDLPKPDNNYVNPTGF